MLLSSVLLIGGADAMFGEDEALAELEKVRALPVLRTCLSE